MHTTADVLPALSVAAPATITLQWCSRCSARGLLLWTTSWMTQMTGPVPVWTASFYGSADAARVLMQTEVDAEKAATATRDSGATPAEFTVKV